MFAKLQRFQQFFSALWGSWEDKNAYSTTTDYLIHSFRLLANMKITGYLGSSMTRDQLWNYSSCVDFLNVFNVSLGRVRGFASCCSRNTFLLSFNGLQWSKSLLRDLVADPNDRLVTRVDIEVGVEVLKRAVSDQS